MKTRGPKPKPTATKKLEGTFRSDRHKSGGIQDIPPLALTPPKGLNTPGKKEFKRIVEIYQQLGILTELDRTSLEAYCDAYAKWTEANEKIHEKGMVQVSEKGIPYMSPWVQIASTYFKKMQGLWSEFGMTPSARTRLEPQKPTEDDLFGRFLHGKE